MEQTKKCSRCGEIKTVSEFYDSQKAKDGKMYWCRECFLENQRQKRALKTVATPIEPSNVVELEVIGFNLRAIELEVIKKALRYYEDASLKFIAKKLVITERTLLRYVKEYSIDISAERKNTDNDIKHKKTLKDHDARELLKALWDKGYDGHFFTYVKQEMSLSKLFGEK